MNNNKKQSESKKVSVEFDSIEDALFFLHTLGFMMRHFNPVFESDEQEVLTAQSQIGSFLMILSNNLWAMEVQDGK